MTCRLCCVIALFATGCTVAPVDNDFGPIESYEPEPTQLVEVVLGRPEIDIIIKDPALAPDRAEIEEAVQARACDEFARAGCLTSPAIHWYPDAMDREELGTGATLWILPASSVMEAAVDDGTGDPAAEVVRAADWAVAAYPGSRGRWRSIELNTSDGRTYDPVPCPDGDGWMPTRWGPGDRTCWEVTAGIHGSWHVVADDRIVVADIDSMRKDSLWP